MSVLISLLYVAAALPAAPLAFVEVRMLWRFLRNRNAIRAAVGGRGTPRRETEAGAAPPPTVTIQIPLYNERTTAERVIRAAARQDYPRDRFDIQVLDDSTDETKEIVARLVDEIRSTGVRIEHLHREHRSGYKAGALAAGLERSQSEFVAIFDADFVPEPSFLRCLLVEEAVFEDPSVAFVQARWSWRDPNQGLLASGLALLLDRHFFVQKPTRDFVGQVTTFNGSAGIWRRRAVEDVGGWSAHTLTEDLDLSYRCAFKGWRGRYVQAVAVASDLPDHMRAFKIQQRRWAKGSAQCVRSLTRRVIASKGVLADRLDEVMLLAGYAIHPVLLANVVLWPLGVLIMDRTLFLALQGLTGFASLVSVASFGITVWERDGRITMPALAELVTGVCVGIGLMVNNSAAQVQGYLESGGEFVRTPKASGAPGRGGVAGYASPLHWTFFAELALVAYCLVGAAVLVANGESLWAIPLLFWATCVGLVAQLQMLPRLA
jgi:cellulose synthase/poly-beta-1,6-N-acetylglucosamine synthase-like glycosyltransferase